MMSMWLERMGHGIGPDLLPWLGDLIGTPVGWSLKTSVILLAAAALSLLFRRATASLRHRVWLVALVSVLFLPLLEVGLPALPLLPSPPAREAVPPVPPVPAPLAREASPPLPPPAVTPPPVSVEVPAPRVPPVERAAALPSSVEARAPAPPAVRSSHAVPPTTRERAEATGPGAGSVSGAEPERERPTSDGITLTAAGVGALVWFGGFSLWTALLAVGLARVGRLYRRGEPAPDTVRLTLDRMARSTGLKRPVPVRLTRGLPVPVTWGWLRPRILLPASAAGWEASRLERVLVHELAHVKRGDWVTGLLGEITRGLHWFNPLVWLAVSRLRTEQERACDDRVLGTGARASDYALDLLDVARGGWGAVAPVPVVPLARSPRLSGRIRDLLDPERRCSPEGPVPAVWASGALAVVFLPVVMVSPAQTAPVPPTDVPAEVAPPAAELTEPALPPAGVVADVSPPIETYETGLTPPPLQLPKMSSLSLPRFLTPGRQAAPVAPRPASGRSALQQQVALCTFEEGGRRSTSINADGDDDWTIKWSTDDCSVEVELRGRVEFNAEEDGIASMGRNASFEVEERIDRRRRRLTADEDGNGGPRYRYWQDGDEGEFDAAARAWFAAFLPQLFRHTTIQAEERVARIFAATGTRGVLDEVGRMRSDHVAARYLGLLMEHSGFEPEEVPSVLAVLAERIDSDHYTAEVLGAVGDRWGIRPEFQESYMEAVRRIGSDHYAHEALMALLERDDLSPQTVRQVVEASSAIDSDHYKASLLGRVARRGPIPEAERPAYIRAVASMDSDHYQHEVVSVFLDDGPLDPGEIAEVLGLTETISSDHYRAEILSRIGSDFDLEGPAVDAFLRSAAGIDSDHYASEVGRIVASRQALSPEQVGLVLDLAGQIESDHSRAQVMITLIREHTLSQEDRARFRELALDIGSDHYQDQVLAALARTER